MPARKPDTPFSYRLARELAYQADVDPRVIQAAAKGSTVNSASARRAREVVAEYFELHPDQAPEGWARPVELPLPVSVAKGLAAEAGVDYRTIQRAAAGLPLHRDVVEAARGAVEKYFTAHPEARPKPAAPPPPPNPAPPRGHELAHEGGEPEPSGLCERCGQTDVFAGGPCPKDDEPGNGGA